MQQILFYPFKGRNAIDDNGRIILCKTQIFYFLKLQFLINSLNGDFGIYNAWGFSN